LAREVKANQGSTQFSAALWPDFSGCYAFERFVNNTAKVAVRTKLPDICIRNGLD
jgi:hypothetical protein